jgi:hypothetical protein
VPTDRPLDARRAGRPWVRCGVPQGVGGGLHAGAYGGAREDVRGVAAQVEIESIFLERNFDLSRFLSYGNLLLGHSVIFWHVYLKAVHDALVSSD